MPEGRSAERMVARERAARGNVSQEGESEPNLRTRVGVNFARRGTKQGPMCPGGRVAEPQ